jgi:hypothetical protein
VVRPPADAPRRRGHAGDALAGHLHQPLQPRGGAGCGGGARGGRLHRPDPGEAGVLRAHLDLHGSAGRRAAAAERHARRARGGRGGRDGDRRRRSRRSPARWPNCWPRRRVGRRPTSATSRRWPNRTATITR